jgi:hypothetical protein
LRFIPLLLVFLLSTCTLEPSFATTKRHSSCSTPSDLSRYAAKYLHAAKLSTVSGRAAKAMMEAIEDNADNEVNFHGADTITFIRSHFDAEEVLMVLFQDGCKVAYGELDWETYLGAVQQSYRSFV